MGRFQHDLGAAPAVSASVQRAAHRHQWSPGDRPLKPPAGERSRRVGFRWCRRSPSRIERTTRPARRRMRRRPAWGVAGSVGLAEGTMRVARTDRQCTGRPEFDLPVVKECVVRGTHDPERCLTGATHEQPELREPIVLMARDRRPRSPELQHPRGQRDEPAVGAVCRVAGNGLRDRIDDAYALDDPVAGLIFRLGMVGSAAAATQDQPCDQCHTNDPCQLGHLAARLRRSSRNRTLSGSYEHG